MAVKKEEDEPFSAPAWIVTFSDMIGLLTSFFIMLMTYSTKDQAQFRRLKGNLLGEFGLLADPSLPDYDSLLTPDEALANKLRNEGLRKERKDLEQLAEGSKILVQKIGGQDVQFERLADGGRLRIFTPSAFPDGGSRLTFEGRRVLGEIADLMRIHKCRIVVVGHCWDEGQNVQGEAAIEQLARDRAIEVALYLTGTGGIAHSRVGIAARGDHDPVERGHGTDAVNRNRRIEIVVLQDA
jgi:chemotaxis protein MotB